MHSILVYILIAFLGLLIGELANLLIDRLPTEDKVYTPNGCCPKCEEKLKWYDQIPIISYLLLGGRCRYCKDRINAQYIWVNLINGLLYCLVYWQYGSSWLTVIYCLCATTLLVLSVIDWRTYEIPVALNYFIFGLGLVHLLLDRHEWQQYVIGFFAVSGLLFLVHVFTTYVMKRDGMGGGDIKLMAAAGLLLGWKYILLALILGSILGSIIHLSIMAMKKGERMLAFGPYLSLGIFIAMMWGEQLISWYLGMMGIHIM